MPWRKKALVVLAVSAAIAGAIIATSVVLTKDNDNPQERSFSSASNGQTFSAAPAGSPQASATTTETVAPTGAPQMSAETVSTAYPSDMPSLTPSSSPSDIPSSLPSDIPSGTPSVMLGSDYPSIVPSSWGTEEPTSAVQKRELASDFPSAIPTKFPTVSPTMNPTVSAKPSSSPSISAGPTISSLPTGTPTISAQPSVSAEPTGSAPPTTSDVPSSRPSVSDFPSLVPSTQPTEYVFRRGGTIVAVAGFDYVVLATDGATDLSGPLVLGEDVTRVFPITDTTRLASQGCKTGVDQLGTSLQIRRQIQERFSGEALTTADTVQLVSSVVYNRRFNSCVDVNVLGGMDVNGNGAVFNYDDIGRFRRVAYTVKGPEQEYVENFLLNSRAPGLTQDDIVNILRSAFVTATARELETGEQLEIQVITNTGVQRIMSDL